MKEMTNHNLSKTPYIDKYTTPCYNLVVLTYLSLVLHAGNLIHEGDKEL